MQCPSLSLKQFLLKFFFNMSIVIPAFFWFPFAWNIFLYPLIFSLYVSLGLKWVSCKQQVYGSYFCVHTSSLCVLIGAFTSFTFEVIINMYVLIAIFLIILGLILYVFFISCVSCLRKFFFFSICCNDGLVVLNSLSFCLSVKFLISPSNLSDILAG